jgi:threonylcarbamoyladenosine tRNA methylthiotransferase MtaB
MARGKSRSDRIENVVKNAKEIAAKGSKEIVLTGVNLGDFGKGADGSGSASIFQREENFYQLIQELDTVEGIERYRISSIEPNLLTNEIIDFVAGSKKFMPHFHIPLQSGSDAILAAMRRRYKRSLYQERVEYIKERMPHCCIGVDVIAGFPGETEELFEETFSFLHQLDISYLHVFTYSERDHTHALNLHDVVPMPIRHQRNKILRNLSYKKMQYFTEQHHNTIRPVLFESQDKEGFMEGYTDNYIKITTPYRADYVNQIIDWEIS